MSELNEAHSSTEVSPRETTKLPTIGDAADAKYTSGDKQSVFHLFCSLPAEIQQNIWELALLDIPGVVLRGDNFAIFSEGDQAGAVSRFWEPGLLDAHPDVRDAAKRLGLLSDPPKSRRDQTVWFNPARDAVFLKHGHLKRLALHQEERKGPGSARPDLLRTAEIVVVSKSSFDDVVAYIALANPERFPKLRRVIILSAKIDLEQPVVVGDYRSHRSFDAGDSIVFLQSEAQLGQTRRIGTIEGDSPKCPEAVHQWFINLHEANEARASGANPGQQSSSVCENFEACWFTARKHYSQNAEAMAAINKAAELRKALYDLKVLGHKENRTAPEHWQAVTRLGNSSDHAQRMIEEHQMLLEGRIRTV